MIQIPQHGQNKKQYKTMICRHFELGNCSIGDSCQFAHGPSELRRPNDPLPCKVPKIEPNLVINNFKTVLCKYHQQGYCKNGTTCSYAHGMTDKKEAKVLSQPKNMVATVLEYFFDHLSKLNESDSYVIRGRNLIGQQQYEEAALQIVAMLQGPNRSEEERKIYEQVYSQALDLFVKNID